MEFKGNVQTEVILILSCDYNEVCQLSIHLRSHEQCLKGLVSS